MKIGLFAVVSGRVGGMAVMKAFAENAERVGFSTLWAPEHVVLLDSYASRYPYRDDGTLPAPSDAPIADPFLTLCTMASVTQKIRLATGICLVPEHNPLVLAKVVASLDYLCGGRFALGVGIGWSAEEFAALGIPFERRVQRTCEYIEAMRKLWSEEKSSYSGEFVSFKDARSFPKPAQGGKVPIIFGGESAPALRRVANYGSGWFGVNLNPAQAAEKIAKLHALLDEKGRRHNEIEIMISPYGNTVTKEDMRAYHELGVTEIVPYVRLPPEDSLIPAFLEQVAREWVEPAAALR
jgi:probable F420-dependent oxidoreductase